MMPGYKKFRTRYVEEKDQTEVEGLAAGAMDFIKKPFVPEILTIRVLGMIDEDIEYKMKEE